ncbi:hypothetical protein M0R79_03910 [Ignavigranum ruoffiae]|uniref:Rgg/GadR/MutR family transcriptional regulator n=1 Tax=Ignavigranum ruoffiae TaxID=89093 RepID=UPI00204D8BDC|nr:Rgg/GadR/MutR family transcriptional regulator [Ignavigranum ruoffiae]UPQ86530.1 hypothetical protein M0R79_03910 [Ignavigranum ruoffiae]
MELYEGINSIRKMKGLSVHQIVGDKLSKSTYYRYVNGENDISSEMFVYLLRKLKISLEELQFYCYGDEFKPERKLMLQLQKSYMRENCQQLHALKIKCQNYFRSTNDIVFQHIEALIEILIARLQDKAIIIKDNRLYKYLFNIESWGHYEISFFNNSLHYFDKETLDILLPRVIQKLNWYHHLDENSNENVRLIANVIIFYLQLKDIKKASYYIDFLNNISITEEMVFEKIVINFFNRLQTDLLNRDYSFKTARNNLEIMKMLNMQLYLKMFTNLLNKLEILIPKEHEHEIPDCSLH